MNILITGGVGYIGSCLLLMLGEEEFTRNSIIRSLDRNHGEEYQKVKRRFENDKRYQLIVGDIRRHEDVKESLESIDVVIHLAAISGLEACKENPDDAIMTNVYGTYNLLEMAIEAGVEQIIFASSAAVYGSPEHYPIVEDAQPKPLNLYGVTKAAGEKLIEAFHKNYELSTTILRLANVYGLGIYTTWNTVTPLFIEASTLGKNMVIYGSGEQSRNFVHVRDVACAIIRCLKAQKKNIAGETFNIGGRKSISINELAELIRSLTNKELGKSVEVLHTSPRLREVDAPNFQYSITKAKQILEYSPSIALEKGITELLHYAKKS